MEEAANIGVKIEHEEILEDLKEPEYLDEIENDLPEFVNINDFSDTNSKKVKEVFSCDLCGKKYNKLEQLEIHKYIHSSEKYCPLCDLNFQRKCDLQCHINGHVKEKIEEERRLALNCDFCEKSFKNPKSRNIHMRVHTNERPYKCNICGKGFKQRGSLKEHTITHANVKPFCCEVCPGTFTTSSSLKRHMKKIHESGKTYICKICDKSLPTYKYLADHKRDQHPEICDKAVRKCPFCPLKFSTSYAYSKHKKIHLASGEVSEKLMLAKSKHKCILCGERFLNYKLFIHHNNKHMQYTKEDLQTALKTGSFTCKLCHREFLDKQRLFEHMHFHMEKTVKCEVCLEYFTFYGYNRHKKVSHAKFECPVCKEVIEGRGRFRYHYDKLHPDTDKKHSCHICGKSYKLKKVLQWHISIIHEQSASYNKHKCHFCGKLCATKATLGMHMGRMHATSARFKCDPCNISFLTRSKLRNHNFMCHSDFKPQKRKFSICKICNQGFRSERTLKLHRRKKHQNVISPTKYQCKLCLKFFKEKRNHKTHLANKVCTKFFAKKKKDFYKCTLCPREFLLKRSLNAHVVVHSNFHSSCRFCGKAYKVRRLLALHIAESHPGEKMYYCGFCDLEFDSLVMLRKHRYSPSHLANIDQKNTVSVAPEAKIDTSVNEKVIKEEPVVKEEVEDS